MVIDLGDPRIIPLRYQVRFPGCNQEWREAGSLDGTIGVLQIDAGGNVAGGVHQRRCGSAEIARPQTLVADVHTLRNHALVEASTGVGVSSRVAVGLVYGHDPG